MAVHGRIRSKDHYELNELLSISLEPELDRKTEQFCARVFLYGAAVDGG